MIAALLFAVFPLAGEHRDLASRAGISPSSASPETAAEYSLEKKIRHLFIVSADIFDLSGARAAASGCAGGIQLQWGSYSLENTAKALKKIRASAQKAGCPPLFTAVDYEGGSVYAPTTLGLLRLPTNMMLGAARDPKETAALFFLAAKELRRAGINITFGPVLDVNTQSRNPIIGIRSVSDDPALVAEIGAAIISGFKAGGIIPVIKHFPGHGDTVLDSHKTVPSVKLSSAELRQVHIYPFEKAIAGQIPAVMTAHVLYPGLDEKNTATFSPKIIGELLRKELNYKGLVITDSLDMRAVTSRRTTEEGALEALKAGADILLIGRGDFEKAVSKILSEAQKDGRVRERVEESYARIIKAKKEHGFWKRKTKTSDFDMAYTDISKNLSWKAVTLAKNERVIPPGVDKKLALILFSPQRFDKSTIHLYKEIRKAGYRARQYKFGISPGEKETAEILKYAGEADIIITGSFQWSSRQNRRQKETIEKLLSLGKPVILISLMSPYDADNYPQAEAIIFTYGITDFSMAAAGKIITGRLRPRGKLPVKIKWKRTLDE